jgi:hypothetical protein
MPKSSVYLRDAKLHELLSFIFALLSGASWLAMWVWIVGAVFSDWSWWSALGLFLLGWFFRGVSREYQKAGQQAIQDGIGAGQININEHGQALPIPAPIRGDSGGKAAESEVPSARRKGAKNLLSSDGLLDGETESGRIKRLRCEFPPAASFDRLFERMPDEERRPIAQKASALQSMAKDLAANWGADVVECERRYNNALLVDLYPNEMRGDFTASTVKARDVVHTLMGAGLAQEALLRAHAPEVLSKVFPTDHRSPVEAVRKRGAATRAEAARVIAELRRDERRS